MRFPRFALAALLSVLLAGAACSSAARPPVTQVEAIAACYTAALDEAPSTEIDRPSTRAEQVDDELWSIEGTAAFANGSLEFGCEVTPQGEVIRTRVVRDTSG